MKTRRCATAAFTTTWPSEQLRSAALAGLLCLATVACSGQDTEEGANSPATAGAGGAAAEPPHITASEDVGVITEAQFTALCDERGGTVEVMPHCGGFATAKGFSYDNATLLLSEHTCAGANTCGGWNCAITE